MNPIQPPLGDLGRQDLRAIPLEDAVTIPNAAKRVDRFGSGVMLAAAGTFFFALKSIFIKFAFAAGATPTLLLTIRLLFSAPVYVAVLVYMARVERRKVAAIGEIAWAMGLGFFGFYLAAILDLYGLELISAQLERLTLFTYPTMVAVMAWLFLGEPLNRKILISIGICYTGVYFMYSGERMLSGEDDVLRGVFYVFGAALSYAFYIVMAKHRMRRIGSRAFTSWAMLGSTLCVCIQFGSSHSMEFLFAAPTMVYVYGLILALVCTVLPSFMINEAIVRLGATRTTIIGSAGPVLTMILAIMLLAEPSSLRHLAGMTLVVVGVSLVAKE